MMKENGVIFQFFHWYHEGNLWNEFAEKAESLSLLGISAVWFPPANKCELGLKGRGYDVYDQYDLGEFNQKGTIKTRYGTKDEYLNAIKKAHENNISVYADIVLNHRMGADETETVTVQKVDGEDRTKKIGEPFIAEAATKFTFPGRGGVYSDFVWDYQCFSGIDRVTKNGENKKGIFKIHNDCGTEWNISASHQFGNYDYLMGADIEYRNPKVLQEIKNWIKWYMEITKADGVRLDALKHISSDFLEEFIHYIKKEINENIFVTGEYWKDDADKISGFSQRMNNLISLFDAPLHYNFFNASKQKKDFDLRTIFKKTFVKDHPAVSVSFVENHDTQPLQGLESSVEEWFKPLAYAIILLSEMGYPCVFYADFYGAEYTDTKDGVTQKIIIPKVEILPKLLEARQKFAFGEQVNYFDDKNCIAWLRKGNSDSAPCVVILSNGDDAQKQIDLGKQFAKHRFRDFLRHRTETIECDENGKAMFTVNSESVSIWISI
jgi:alpha-amylase